MADTAMFALVLGMAVNGALVTGELGTATLMALPAAVLFAFQVYWPRDNDAE